MEAHLHRRLTVPELARAAGLSVSHLTRLFRQATGRSPGVFLTHLRMTRARFLVEGTSLTITEVMSQVAASNRSHFARAFRCAHGLSPRRLRVQLRTDRPKRAADL
jgi:AraC family transcriptional regulator